MQEVTQNIIKRYYDCFNRKNVSAFLELLDQEIVHDINQGTSEIGRDAFAVFMSRMNACYDESIYDLVVMTNEDGSRASAEFIVEGAYLVTDSGLPSAQGQKYRLACGAFFQIENNKIKRVTNYYNMQDWLAQIKD